MYCMPQKGTRVTLYLGNGREQDGIVTGCIHTSSETCQEMGSPQNKSFRTEHGNGLDLHPGSMGVSSNGGSIRISDQKGTILESAGDITISAGGKILIEAGEEIKISAMTQIGGMTSAASLCINGNLDFKGENMVLAGRDYKAYEPFNDAQEEGEFDWDGFMTNLAMGVLATAVLAGAAAFTIATGGAGGILAGALVGAAMGTLSATITGAIGELKSGNVRSTGEVIRDLAVSGISGAVTGAIGVKLPKKEGIVNCLIEGFANSVGSALERAIAAIADKDMSWADKKKYIFDIKQMGIDFAVGMGIGHAVNKINARKPGGKPKDGMDLKDGSSSKSGIELEDGSNSKMGSKSKGRNKTKNDSKFKDITECVYDVGSENDGKSKKGGNPQNGSKPKNGNKPKNGKSNKDGGHSVKNGATRAAQYSSEWAGASLQEAINKFAPNVEPVVTSKGKVIYNNPETGISVVYDKNGNYFRIEDTTKPRGRNYLDMDGNDMNNEVVNGKTRGRSKSDYQKVTHFKNTDK